MIPLTKAVIENFKAALNKKGECLIWTGDLNKEGEGVKRLAGKRYLAHEIAWQMEHGEVDAQIHNACGNPACCNPKHWAKERKTSRGEKHYRAKLMPADIIYIRTSPKKAAELARELGVGGACIEKVLKRRTWKHV